MNTLLRALKVYIDSKINKSIVPQVNSDWNEESVDSASYIKNKPFSETVADITVVDGPISLSKTSEATEDGYTISVHYTVLEFEKNISEITGSKFEDVIFENTVGSKVQYAESDGEDYIQLDSQDIYIPDELVFMLFPYALDEGQPFVAYGSTIGLVVIADNKAIISTFDLVGITLNGMSLSLHVKGIKKIDGKFITLPDDLEVENSISIGRESDSPIGELSVSVGYDSSAQGQSSASFGAKNTAGGYSSMAIGEGTSAYGGCSLSLGYGTFAGTDSHASIVGGIGTVSRTPGTATFGAFNVYDTMYPEWTWRTYYQVGRIIVYEQFVLICIKAHTSNYTNSPAGPDGKQYWEIYKDYVIQVVGNGTDSGNRSNAYTLTRNGDAWFSGDVYVHSTSGTNKDEGSKKLITEDDLAGIVLLPEVTAEDNGKVMMVSNGQWTVGNTADITPVPYAEGVEF